MIKALDRFWELLKATSAFSFETKCGPNSKTGWEGIAEGMVRISSPKEYECIFDESCRFQMKTGESFDLKNKYLWVRKSSSIEVSHLRRVEPVFLVELEPWGSSEGREFRERSRHLCGADEYRLQICLLEKGFSANWRITGPKKDELIEYVYV